MTVPLQDSKNIREHVKNNKKKTIDLFCAVLCHGCEIKMEKKGKAKGPALNKQIISE